MVLIGTDVTPLYVTEFRPLLAFHTSLVTHFSDNRHQPLWELNLLASAAYRDNVSVNESIADDGIDCQLFRVDEPYLANHVSKPGCQPEDLHDLQGVSVGVN